MIQALVENLLEQDFRDQFKPASQKELRKRKRINRIERNPAEARRLLSQEVAHLAKEAFGYSGFSVGQFRRLCRDLYLGRSMVFNEYPMLGRQRHIPAPETRVNKLVDLYSRIAPGIWTFWSFWDRCKRVLDRAVRHGYLEAKERTGKNVLYAVLRK
jgi:hypothetical protein